MYYETNKSNEFNKQSLVYQRMKYILIKQFLIVLLYWHENEQKFQKQIQLYMVIQNIRKYMSLNIGKRNNFNKQCCNTQTIYKPFDHILTY